MRALTPLISLVLLCAACSTDDTPPVTTPDTGVAFDTGVPADTGVPPGCVPGRSEACACNDGTMGAQVCQPDGTFAVCVCDGVPDAGPVTGPGDEGYPPHSVAACPDGTDRCCDDSPNANLGCDLGLECRRLSATTEEDEAMVVRSCLRSCETDVDCEISDSNPLCREVRFGFDACVASEVQEGETANLSQVNGPLSGCSNDLSSGGTHLVGISRSAGSGLWELDDEESSCARQCSPNDPSDCTARAPHCTAPFFNSMDVPGICVVARSVQGAPCSRKDATQQCSRNRDEDGRLVCWDYLGQYDDDTRGTCHQLCNIANQDCVNVHDATQTPTCLQSLTSTITGMCNDGCSRHPGTCQGTGSDRVGGEPGLGMNCTYGFIRDSGSTVDNPDIAICYDIVDPVLDIWDFTAGGDNCEDAANSCPMGSYCQSDGTTGDSFCVFGCTTSTTAQMSGCEAHPAPHEVCNSVRTDTIAGFCAPF